MSAIARRAAAVHAVVLSCIGPAVVGAQAAVLEIPPGQVLQSLTPVVRARALGFPRQFQFQYRLSASPSPDSPLPAVIDTFVVTADTVVDIQVTRPLPSEAVLYFRLDIIPASGVVVSAPIQGPRQVPRWLTLISPNPLPSGDQLDTRQPLFVWRSAPVVSTIGPWRYDFEITQNGGSVVGTSGITDTTFRPTIELETNAQYRWSVRAYLPRGETIRQTSLGTFGVMDPATPSATLFYQNFPNPFPTPTSFVTCFWFDVANPGGLVALDILDLRGNLVKRLIPAADGQREFPGGRYGRGAVGAGNNCDGRFVWDATADDGRSVSPGVYLARFAVAGGAPTFKRVYFRGR